MLQGCAYLLVIDFFDIVTSSGTMRMHFSSSQLPISYHDMVDDTAHKYELRVIRRSFLTEIGEHGWRQLASFRRISALAIADTSNFTSVYPTALLPKPQDLRRRLQRATLTPFKTEGFPPRRRVSNTIKSHGFSLSWSLTLENPDEQGITGGAANL